MTDDYTKGWNDAIKKAAEIAANVYLHTGSMTVERDVANRICPRIAKAIQAERKP